MPPNAAAPYRIRKGEGIGLIVWSNTAVTIGARFRVVYDNGRTDEFLLNELASGSARAAVLGVCRPKKADDDGVIVSATVGTVGTAVSQRGQCYIQLLLLTDPEGSGAITVLGCGYMYAGHAPALGEFVEPGPAGGHGAYSTFSGTNQAAGTLPSDVLPVGSIWRVRSYECPLVTDANAGNRQFLLVIDDASVADRIFAAQNNNNQAATLTRTWAWFLGTDLSTSVGATFTDTQVVLPAYNLKESLVLPAGAARVRLVSTGALAFTATDDFGIPIIIIEEWVMPN